MDGSKPARIMGYAVYRSDDPSASPAAPVNAQMLQQPEYEDRNFEFDKTYYYAVSIIANDKEPNAVSFRSKALAVTPRDTFPPGAPGNLQAVAEATRVILLWTAPPETDIAGYRIYRGEEGLPEGKLLQSELITGLSYRDEQGQPGKRYRYRIVAVDTHGNESAPALTEVDIR
jgi:predicted phage tail protein